MDCILASNLAFRFGGAVQIFINGSFVSSSTVFSENVALNGGALYSSNFARFNFTNCLFYKNIAMNSGGAVFLFGLSTLLAVNCNFSVNMAQSGGGIYIEEPSLVRINNSVFSRNKAFVLNAKSETCSFVIGSGGACFFRSFNSDNIILNNNSFLGNIAEGHGGAFGILDYNVENRNLIEKSGTFLGNLASWFVSEFSTSPVAIRVQNMNFSVYPRRCIFCFC
jgi:predicted outer membrane repeat protein